MFSRKCLVIIVIFLNCSKQMSTISTRINEIGTSTEKIKARNILNLPTYNRKLKNHSYLHYNTIEGNYGYPNIYQKYTNPNAYRPIGQNMYFHPEENSNFGGNQNINLKESILDILHSIARNDDLLCVPKILCEMTSGTIHGRQQGFNIPLNVNAGSLLGLLSSMNGLDRSPLFYFGKAAILGYSSKGNTRSCETAYPHCPSEPDKLIQYLNNHNGGFFRYFNGFSSANFAPHYQHPDPSLYQNQKRDKAQISATRRIQNKPDIFIQSNNLDGIIKFPDDRLKYNEIPQDIFRNNFNNIFSFGRPYKSLKFPSDYNDISDGEIHRAPKTISNFHSNRDILRFERPSSYHKATELIFPDRTGTGELIIDSAEFDKSNIAYEDNDIRIKYNSYRNNNGPNSS